MSELKDYFSDDELKCKESGVVKLDPHFSRALLMYRESLGFPLYVNSCCRSIRHNDSVGGAPRSYHLFEGVNDGRQGTLAIDLHVKDSVKRAIMVKEALIYGWSVGVYKTFIHIDRRVDVGAQQIMFRGGS